VIDILPFLSKTAPTATLFKKTYGIISRNFFSVVETEKGIRGLDLIKDIA